MVASVDHHFHSFHLPCIDMLIKSGNIVDVAAKVTDGTSHIPGVKQQYDVPFERSPFKLSNIKIYRQLKRIIEENDYNIIHCHTPVASVLARMAARKARKKGVKVIYTAHGFHFYKGAPLINWLIYYPIERLCSYITDVLITINQEDYERARRKMKAKSIEYIPGVGIETQKYTDCNIDKFTKRKELGLPIDAIILLSVGELNKNKNHEIIIRAVAELNRQDLHYVIAGPGSLEKYLCELSDKLGVKSQIHILGLRKDIPELCKMADIFCFPSKREGLPVSLVEAMASGVPCVASDIRGCNDVLQNGTGGFLCDSQNISAFVEAFNTLIQNADLCSKMSVYNKQAIQPFDLNSVISYTHKLYGLLLNHDTFNSA